MTALTLDDILVRLRQCRPEQQVRYDFEWLVPTKIGSFRGYYADMTLGFGMTPGCYGRGAPDTDAPTVESLTTHIESMRGGEVMSWKSGEYPVRMDTPVWVANDGNPSETRIVRVVSEGTEDGDYVILVTRLESESE